MNEEVSVPHLVIEPPKKWVPLKLREVWEYRELLWSLAKRDLTIRYKQTELGAAWAVVQPLLLMVVFTVVLSFLQRVPTEKGVPYPVNTYIALLPWTYFASSINQAGNSLVSNAMIITKIYFPRLILPLASMFAYLVDLAIASLVLVGLMAYYHLVPPVAVVTLPLFVLMATLTALAVGLWLSALNVEYRDVRYLITFLTQVWMYLTPVIYPLSLVPERFRLIYSLNPMVGVVEGFRWALLGKVAFPAVPLALSSIVVAVLLATGAFYFRSMEKTFADVV